MINATEAQELTDTAKSDWNKIESAIIDEAKRGNNSATFNHCYLLRNMSMNQIKNTFEQVNYLVTFEKYLRFDNPAMPEFTFTLHWDKEL
jgi:hypothetical protein